MEGDRIEESSARLLDRSASGSESRWVDGSEVDSESPPWSLAGENEGREGFGSLRRRLVKKPKRVDSLDVEALEISGAHGHHAKVITVCCLFVCVLLSFFICNLMLLYLCVKL